MNLPSIEDMLAALDAKGAQSQEEWNRVAALIMNVARREVDAINTAKLVLQDGATLREELEATLNGIESRLQQHEAIQPQG